MTRFQRAFSVFLNLCFFSALAVLPEPFFLHTDVYRQLPAYRFLEEKNRVFSEDWETVALLIENNGQYLAEKGDGAVDRGIQEEITGSSEKKEAADSAVPAAGKSTPEAKGEEKAAAEPEKSTVELAPRADTPMPQVDLSMESLEDYDYILNQFFILDENTETSAQQLNALSFLEKDFTIRDTGDGPQILIYHSHSQEGFTDSREGVTEDTVTGVGDYLTELLTRQYGYEVIHVREAFDIIEGEIDRSRAYDYAREYVEQVLAENPSVEVVIDLHRDGVDEDRHLVTEINGKPTAQIMFYNGLSYTKSQGKVEYLPNPYIEDNLAFSFQLEYQAALYYPELYRGIYLAGLRYNLHLRPRALLLEAGAQTNTLQEVKNAMEPFADILDKVLRGKKGTEQQKDPG